MIIAFVSLVRGLITDTLSWGRRESRLLRYDNLAPPARPGSAEARLRPGEPEPFRRGEGLPVCVES